MLSDKPQFFTPPDTMLPIGPYSHVARAGNFIVIGGVAGVDPATGELAGADVAAQTMQIIRSFDLMLRAAGSDLDHVLHINVFLRHMSDFGAMNAAYEKALGGRRPARTAVAVADLPKPGALLTMNLTAVVAGRDRAAG